jgi:type I restriction enzyme S subunit
MKSNYKRLGDFIMPCDEKNTGNIIKKLQGISNQKYFQKSHTNTIGVDLEKYRIVRTGQFAFNRATTRNGEKISIALRQGKDCIVSPSYRIFKSKNENILNSEYLMMWFKRPEFDRFARFKSHGSAHEFFDYGEMCEVELPIPSPEKQLEIVREYNVIQNRILLNNQLISKLEETAQAIYKQWFVDFEFPDENGKPYKSNGGEMVWCAELEKEIPEGWSVPIIGDIVETIGGGTPSTDEDEYWVNGDIPWYSPTDVTRSNSMFSSITERKITEKGLQKSSAKMFPPYSLLMTSRATVGKLTINTKEACTNQGFITLIPTEKISVYLLYDWIKTQLEEITSLATGSTFPEISKTDFRNLKFIYPNEDILNKYKKPILHVYKTVQFRNEENQKLEELKDLLLARMTRV